MSARHAAEPRQRCAARAHLRGDPMLGTAFPAARLLLVEQPFPWGPEGLRTSRFDRATALALEARGRTEGVRVQAIRRLGRSTGVRLRRWAVVDTRGARPMSWWGTYEADRELLDLPLDGSTGVPDPFPLYLVCTHGRHDPCCGQRGHRLATALASIRRDRVWQSSHIGGCRFAPSVLVLPSGEMYGRVPAAGAGALVDAAESGTVDTALLRGRIGVPPVAQAAIAFAQEQLDLPRSRDLSFISLSGGDSTVIVRLRSALGPLEVSVQRRRIDAEGLTCAAPGPSWFVAHTPTAIARLASGDGPSG